jgi:arylsulfatase A-like enzyme
MYDIDEIELPENFYDNMLDKPNFYRRTKDRFAQLTVKEYKEAIRHFLAFCTYEDWLFGRLVNILKEEGQYDNTIIIYTSDHGDYCGEHGLFTKGLPCFRSAYHVPMIIRWPGVTTSMEERNIDKWICLADFAPSILEIAGIEYDKDKYSGKSFVPLIKGNKEAIENWEDVMYTQTNGNELYGIQRSIMTPKWKYVYNGFDYDELYNLEEDPHEMINVANKPEYRPIIRQLAAKLWKFAYERKDTCINPYIMVSLAEFGPGIIF